MRILITIVLFICYIVWDHYLLKGDPYDNDRWIQVHESGVTSNLPYDIYIDRGVVLDLDNKEGRFSLLFENPFEARSEPWYLQFPREKDKSYLKHYEFMCTSNNGIMFREYADQQLFDGRQGTRELKVHTLWYYPPRNPYIPNEFEEYKIEDLSNDLSPWEVKEKILVKSCRVMMPYSKTSSLEIEDCSGDDGIASLLANGSSSSSLESLPMDQLIYHEDIGTCQTAEGKYWSGGINSIVETKYSELKRLDTLQLSNLLSSYPFENTLGQLVKFNNNYYEFISINDEQLSRKLSFNNGKIASATGQFMPANKTLRRLVLEDKEIYAPGCKPGCPKAGTDSCYASTNYISYILFELEGEQHMINDKLSCLAD